MSKTTELWKFGICVVVSPFTCVVDNAESCVALMTAIPLVLMAATCVALSDEMSVVVSA